MKPVEQRLADENRAIYLPAISEPYARAAIRDGSIGATNVQYRDLDFLDPASSLFHYPYALYSAGQAAPDREGAAPTRDMVTKRDRDQTIILGDSGGYQIQTGAIKFTDKTAGRMMRWMEQVSDWSMVMDFPTGGIASGNLAPHIERLTREGVDVDALNANRMGRDYNVCLWQTKQNNDFFIANRTPGDTHFLNVLQGRNERESSYWYEQVKHYDFEGWAFAGAHQNSFDLLLARLLDMRDDGLLGKVDWLHVLGKTTLPIGVLLTRVQRAVRRHVNPRFQISFDAASPFLLAANGSAMFSSQIAGEGWSTQSVGMFELAEGDEDETLAEALNRHLASKSGHKPLEAARTAISQRVRLRDVRDMTVTKNVDGKPRRGAMRPDGPFILMNHNVEALLAAHDEAHEREFGEAFVRDPAAAPVSVRTIGGMIDLLFGDEAILGDPSTRIQGDPRDHIREWRPYLAALRQG